MKRDEDEKKTLVLVQLVSLVVKAAWWLTQAAIKIVSIITPRWMKQLLAWGAVFGVAWLFVVLRPLFRW